MQTRPTVSLEKYTIVTTARIATPGDSSQIPARAVEATA